MRKRVKLPRALRIAILERQNMRCVKCSRVITLEARTLREWKKELGHYPDRSVPSQAKFHHVTPVAKGGSNSPENLMGLCGRCHGSGHDYYRKYKK